MTWAEGSGSTTPTWNASDATVLTWTAPSTSYASGNFSRFIDADPLADGSGGIDFNVTATTENPAIVTTRAPVTVTDTNRNDPA